MQAIKSQIKSILSIMLCLLIFHPQVVAQETPGLSGFFHVTGGLFNYRTNTVARFIDNNISNKVTNSLYTLPEAQYIVTPLGAIELKYTFKDKSTQLFFGSSIFDIVRLDFVQQVAVRKLFGNGEQMSIGALMSTIPVAVWEDPFVVDVERVEADRESLGARLEWINIAQSNLGFQYDFRKIKLEERSGSFLGLTVDEQKLLNRNGFTHRLTVNYTMNVFENHTFMPIVKVLYGDAKGEAKKELGASVEINHVYRKARLAMVTNLSAGYKKNKAINPIYQTKQSNAAFEFVESVFYRLNNNPNRVWLGTTSVAYVRSNSNIEFFSQSGLLAQIGIMLRFSPKSNSNEID